MSSAVVLCCFSFKRAHEISFVFCAEILHASCNGQELVHLNLQLVQVCYDNTDRLVHCCLNQVLRLGGLMG